MVIEETSHQFMLITFAELAQIFLAPILAAIVWFVLLQGSPSIGIYTVAAISFGIGLITTNIVNSISKLFSKYIP